MPDAETLSQKWTVGQEAKLRGQLWIFKDNLSAKDIILQYTCKPESYIFYFITLRLICTTRFISGKHQKQGPMY